MRKAIKYGLFLITVVILLYQHFWVVMGIVAIIILIVSSVGAIFAYNYDKKTQSKEQNDSSVSKPSFLYLYEDKEKLIAMYYKGLISTDVKKLKNGFNLRNSMEYEEGVVYKDARPIGYYENGKIFKGNSRKTRKLVGYYADGKIIDASVPTLVWGSYSGDDEGGAATALCYLFAHK